MKQKIGFICGFWHDKHKAEDLALTPYLFLVNTLGSDYKTLGLGVQIFRFAIFFTVGQKPLGYPQLKLIKSKGKQ